MQAIHDPSSAVPEDAPRELIPEGLRHMGQRKRQLPQGRVVWIIMLAFIGAYWPFSFAG
jgi:hypothetical protein